MKILSFDGSACRNASGSIKSAGCLSDYKEESGKCVRQITKYYYNSVILIPKGSA